MSAYRFLFCVLCLLSAIVSGCTSLAVGDTALVQENLTIHVANGGDPVQAGVQVRIYQIQDLVQKELITTGVSMMLERGDNVVTVPVRLSPGMYKLYVYVTVNSERVTASIRDITV